MEGSWHKPETTFEPDVVFGGRDEPHDLMFVVFDLRQTVWHGAHARPIAAPRNIVAERLVRSLEIVDGAPFVESTLRLGEVAQTLQGKDLGIQRAVEALIFAAAL